MAKRGDTVFSIMVQLTVLKVFVLIQNHTCDKNSMELYTHIQMSACISGEICVCSIDCTNVSFPGETPYYIYIRC